MISVIVPVYQVEKYLDRCIESIINQTFSDLELILVDDGSPDHSGAICDKWAEKDARIQVIHKQNGGVSSSRNAGLDAAQGDYISFVDSDDWIAPDLLETLDSAARRSHAEMVCCGYSSMSDDGYALGSDLRPITPGTYTEDEYWTRFFKESDRMYFNVVWGKLYQRKLFEKHRFAIGQINEDALIIYDLVCACRLITLLSERKYYYRVRPNSIMHSKRDLRYLAAPRAYLNRAESFLTKEKWYLSEEALSLASRELLLKDYGEGGKSSSAYKSLKRRVWIIYKHLFIHMTIIRKLTILVFLFSEPIASVLNSISSGKEK